MSIVPQWPGHGLSGLVTPPARSPERLAAGGADNPHADVTQRSAWLMHMERAQMASWFTPFEPDTGRPDAAGAPAGHAMPQPAPREAMGRSALPVQAGTAAAPVPSQTGVHLARLLHAPMAEARSVQAASAYAEAAGNGGSTQALGNPAASPASARSLAAGATQRQDMLNANALAEPVFAVESAQPPPLPAVDGQAGSRRSATPSQPGARAGSDMPVVMSAQEPSRVDANPTVVLRLVQTAAQNQSLELAPDTGATAGSNGPQPGAGESAAASGDVASMAAGARQSDKVRVHVQWNGQHAQVWLGIDGGLEQVQAQAALIVPALARYLYGQGQKLGRVTCNGCVVWDTHEQSAPLQASHFDDFVAHQRQLQALPHQQPVLPLPQAYFLPSP